MSTQPTEATLLVKKAPRRRSSPVATQGVPDWQMVELTLIGRPIGSTVSPFGVAGSASGSVAVLTEMSAFSQARSTTLFVSSQTPLPLPLCPAVIHGKKTRLPAGAAMVTGAFQ